MNLELHLDLRTSPTVIAAARAAVAESKTCSGDNWGYSLGTLQATVNILAEQLERAHAALRSTRIEGLQAANEDIVCEHATLGRPA
ncbi:MAG TPA: hypothetical protein VLC71_06070 [Thermomonas sp.]|nr:hypothetical protein [Thermomonas sp.]